MAVCGPYSKGWYQFVGAGVARFILVQDWESRWCFIRVIVIDIMKMVINLSEQERLTLLLPDFPQIIAQLSWKP